MVGKERREGEDIREKGDTERDPWEVNLGWPMGQGWSLGVWKDYLTHPQWQKNGEEEGTDAGLQEVEAFSSDGVYFLRKWLTASGWEGYKGKELYKRNFFFFK